MKRATHIPPDLVLGTAMWGWTIDREGCFALLDEFYQRGGRRIDTATNYPINKNPSDFRRAEKLLAEWITAHEVTDLEVIMKVGSLNNMMTPDQNLSPSFLMICAEEYENLLGANLACMMIHWDNRKAEKEIDTTMSTLLKLGENRWKIGLSGIRYPEIYAEVLAAHSLEDLPVELKHNLLYTDYERYAPLHQRSSFIAYGINAGGIKLDPQGYSSKASLLARGGNPDTHEKLTSQLNNLLTTIAIPSSSRGPELSMNQLGMLYAAYHPGISGILLGPSRVEHLTASFSWLQQLYAEDYTPLYEALEKLEA